LKIYFDAQEVERSKQFKYLGSVIHADAHCYQNIKNRIAMENIVFFNAKKNILTSKLNLELRKRFVIATVWSIILYAAETWPVTRNHRMKLAEFEIWIWRKMLKISWTQKVTNEEVLT